MKEFSPIITIHGNKELYIENFKKIYELRNELVKIMTESFIYST